MHGYCSFAFIILVFFSLLLSGPSHSHLTLTLTSAVVFRSSLAVPLISQNPLIFEALSPQPYHRWLLLSPIVAHPCHLCGDFTSSIFSLFDKWVLGFWSVGFDPFFILCLISEFWDFICIWVDLTSLRFFWIWVFNWRLVAWWWWLGGLMMEAGLMMVVGWVNDGGWLLDDGGWAGW